MKRSQRWEEVLARACGFEIGKGNSFLNVWPCCESPSWDPYHPNLSLEMDFKGPIRKLWNGSLEDKYPTYAWNAGGDSGLSLTPSHQEILRERGWLLDAQGLKKEAFALVQRCVRSVWRWSLERDSLGFLSPRFWSFSAKCESPSSYIPPPSPAPSLVLSKRVARTGSEPGNGRTFKSKFSG